jgi:hypothetical protein
MIGITKRYEVIYTEEQELILNNKVVDFLTKTIDKDRKRGIHLVYMTSSSTYKEIDRDLIVQLLKAAESDESILDKPLFAELVDYPEYDNCPFNVSHASPWDHRYPGDYDEDAYDDWDIVTYSLMNIFCENYVPYYEEHPEQFDFKPIRTKVSEKKLLKY